MHAEVTIVGAGILGVALALHLAREGCSTILLEREAAVGRHASGKNAGMFRQLYRHPQLTDWARRSPSLWPEAARQMCFEETGSIVVGRRSPGHSLGLFEERVVRVPSRGEVDAVFTKTDGLLDSAAFLPLCVAELPQKVARVAYETKALSAEWSCGTWKVHTGESTIESSRLVVGNGAWVSRLPVMTGGQNLTLGQDLLRPIARFLFTLEGLGTNFMPEPDCGFYWNELDEWYLRKLKPASAVFSICDAVPADPDLPPAPAPSREPGGELERLLSLAFGPAASGLRIADVRQCFRTYTPDQLPIWGPDPRQDNLFWLAGFGGFGMSTGFAAASDLSRVMSGKRVTVSNDVIIERFLPTDTCR